LQRAQEIRQATEVEFEAIKQQIINVLSHELRTPLTYIAGYTELALDDISSLSMDELQEFLTRIKRGSDRLHNLVEDLLIGVQLDTGRSQQEFDTFSRVHDDLGQMVQHVVHTYRSQAAAADVQLEVEMEPELPPVLAYEEFLEDALARIIDNAIKFSRDAPKHVKVRAYASDDEVLISVSDRGVGINPEHVDRLFERFEQLDRSKMEQQGTGMGLYIANALVQIHGGQITVESEVGEGSTFTIHLPTVQTG
jgi:signal transduction histidine kinase